MSVALGNLLVFAGSQIGTPGPANMAMMATGARFGFRAAMPFVAGVLLGKQLIIWPIGFGLMGLVAQVPFLFETLKWLSAAYILWLAWKVANLRLKPANETGQVPGFFHGLVVHPLNPKAWALITTSFTSFVSPATPVLQATFLVAICLFGVQLVMHPVWTYAGEAIARTVAGHPAERFLMWTLAGLTVLSLIFALFSGGKP
jgi:threonine/homoserine/homoserine lactone efflux protein